MVNALGNAFAAVQLSDGLFTAKTIHHYADLFFSRVFCLRVAQRMSSIALVAPVWHVYGFCLIFVPFGN